MESGREFIVCVLRCMEDVKPRLERPFVETVGTLSDNVGNNGYERGWWNESCKEVFS